MVSIALPWCLGLAAPYYNIALVIFCILLFIKLLKIPTQLYKKPWKLLFIAVLVYVLEEILTILANINLISFPHFTVGFFEMIIILLFIYMLLLQRDYIKKSAQNVSK